MADVLKFKLTMTGHISSVDVDFFNEQMSEMIEDVKDRGWDIDFPVVIIMEKEK